MCVHLYMRDEITFCLRCGFVGAGRFVEDLRVMLGYRIPVYWKIAWMFIAPFVIVVRQTPLDPHFAHFYETVKKRRKKSNIFHILTSNLCD